MTNETLPEIAESPSENPTIAPIENQEQSTGDGIVGSVDENLTISTSTSDGPNETHPLVKGLWEAFEGDVERAIEWAKEELIKIREKI